MDTPTVDDSTLETGDSFTLSASATAAMFRRLDHATLLSLLRFHHHHRRYGSRDGLGVRAQCWGNHHHRRYGSRDGLGVRAHVSSGGSSDESINDLTAPDTAGTYYYGACVDSVSGESDTTNNCSVSVTVAVEAAPEPDPTPTPTPKPTGKAVTGTITSCEGEQLTPGIDSYRITIAGTVTASRAVENVRVEGTFNGSFVGIDVLGDMAAGEIASFSVTGYVSESVGTCGADLEWLEIN